MESHSFQSESRLKNINGEAKIHQCSPLKHIGNALFVPPKKISPSRFRKDLADRVGKLFGIRQFALEIDWKLGLKFVSRDSEGVVFLISGRIQPPHHPFQRRGLFQSRDCRLARVPYR